MSKPNSPLVDIFMMEQTAMMNRHLEESRRFQERWDKILDPDGKRPKSFREAIELRNN